MVPKAARIALLVNPSNATLAQVSLREIPDAARSIGLQLRVLQASTIGEIDAAFSSLIGEPADALFVDSDGFFNSRRVQFALLAARYAIPAVYADREYPEVGGLMSYTADIDAAFRQAGIYIGRILNGTKPADLPVVRSVKLELVINLQAARLLGLESLLRHCGRIDGRADGPDWASMTRR
jgi:putative ABC transport system substrate-binding protein